LKGFSTRKTIDLYERNGILTEREVEARHEIKLEYYTKKIQIESRILGDLATNHIIPIAIKYQNTLIENVKGLKEVLDLKTYGKLSRNQMETITEISEHVSWIKTYVNEMIEARKVANKTIDPEVKAIAYCDEVRPFFEKIRDHVDKLELLVDDEVWPLPKYRELLFIR
jgi:glutamine synthetase